MRKPRHGHRNKRKFLKAYEVFAMRMEEDRLVARVEKSLRGTKDNGLHIEDAPLAPGDIVRDMHGSLLEVVSGKNYGTDVLPVARRSIYAVGKPEYIGKLPTRDTLPVSRYNVSKGKWVR